MKKIICAIKKIFRKEEDKFEIGEMVWVPMYLRHQKMPIYSIEENGFWIQTGPHSLMDQLFVDEVHKIRT